MSLAARLLSGSTPSGCSDRKGRSVTGHAAMTYDRYFATRFRHAFGLTPTRYRQRAGGQARYEALTVRQNKMTNFCRKIVGL